MKPRTHEILNDPELIDLRNDYHRRMEDVYAGRNDGSVPFVLSGMTGGIEVPEGLGLKEHMHCILDGLAEQAEEGLRDPRVFRPICTGATTFGGALEDLMFHAVHTDMEKDRDQQFLKCPVGSLEPPDIDSYEGWKNLKLSTEIFLEADVALPLFESLSSRSPLVLAVSLYGEPFLMALLDNPDAALHDMKIITDVGVQMRKWFVKHVPIEQLQGIISYLRGAPPGYGQFDGCTTQLLGPDTYRELVAPLDRALCDAHPNGGVIHICGYHTQHIPTWREMKSLRVLQLSGDAMTDLPVYHSELRDDQVVIVSPHATMELKEIVEVTQGKRVIIALYPKDLHRVGSDIDGLEV